MKANRLVIALAGLMSLIATGAVADWRADFPKIVFGPVSSEDLDTKTKRWTPMADYLAEALGVDVELRYASDYAGILQAMDVGEVHIASFGGGPYATAWDMLDGDLEPLAMTTGTDGTKGYYSVVIAPADSEMESIDDIEGKSIAFSDPNSTSGYLVPSFYLRREGKLEDFVGSVNFSGGHENSILAMLRGDYDVAATGMATYEISRWGRMAEAGTIPENAVKVLWKSPIIMNPAFSTRKSFPDEMKADIRAALLAFPEADPEGFAVVSDGDWGNTEAVTHEAYADFIDMRAANLKQRKSN